jgi:hypothetical protein
MDLQNPFAILARIMVRIRALGEADVAQWEIETVACSFGRTRAIKYAGVAKASDVRQSRLLLNSMPSARAWIGMPRAAVETGQLALVGRRWDTVWCVGRTGGACHA